MRAIERFLYRVSGALLIALAPLCMVTLGAVIFGEDWFGMMMIPVLSVGILVTMGFCLLWLALEMYLNGRRIP